MKCKHAKQCVNETAFLRTLESLSLSRLSLSPARLPSTRRAATLLRPLARTSALGPLGDQRAQFARRIHPIARILNRVVAHAHLHRSLA